jgi:hypothetical protein
MPRLSSIILALVMWGAHGDAQQPGKSPTAPKPVPLQSLTATATSAKTAPIKRPIVNGGNHITITPRSETRNGGFLSYLVEGCLGATEELSITVEAGEHFWIQVNPDPQFGEPVSPFFCGPNNNMWRHSTGVPFYGPEGYQDGASNYNDHAIDPNIRLGSVIAGVSSFGNNGDLYNKDNDVHVRRAYSSALYVGRQRIDESHIDGLLRIRMNDDPRSDKGAKEGQVKIWIHFWTGI